MISKVTGKENDKKTDIFPSLPQAIYSMYKNYLK